MNIKRMAELSGVPGLIESLTESEAEIDIERFPEVTKVTGFAPEWPGPDVERTLRQMPLPALTSNIDRAAFRLTNLGVLALDAQGAAWHIYLTPRASDGEIDAAIEMARRALIPAIERGSADWLSNYRRQNVLPT